MQSQIELLPEQQPYHSSRPHDRNYYELKSIETLEASLAVPSFGLESTNVHQAGESPCHSAIEKARPTWKPRPYSSAALANAPSFQLTRDWETSEKFGGRSGGTISAAVVCVVYENRAGPH